VNCDNNERGDNKMLGRILGLTGGPMAVVVGVAELVLAASKVVEALQDEEEDEK
jgi:hypothetical protein